MHKRMDCLVSTLKLLVALVKRLFSLSLMASRLSFAFSRIGQTEAERSLCWYIL